MSTIQSTVSQHVPSQYAGQARAAIRALEAREAAIVDAAKRVMAEKGLSDRESTQVLVTIGLVEPTPEPASTTSGVDNGLLQRLASFARQHGFSG